MRGRTQRLGSRVRLGHARLLRPEEQAVHVGKLHRVVVCSAQQQAGSGAITRPLQCSGLSVTSADDQLQLMA